MAYPTEIPRLLDYIEAHLSQKIGLQELADIAYLSKYHFHRIFRRETGESVTRYITGRRMARAAAELAMTDNRILDIALEYQYGSHEAFTRAFKRFYGISPETYRKTHAASPKRTAALPAPVRTGGMTMSARAA